FAAGKRGRRLAQSQIAQANLIQHSQTVRDLVHITEEGDGLAHRHLQHVMNVLAAITHVENLLFEPGAFAFFANQFYVWEELHLNRDRAVPLTDLTTSSGDVK